MKVSHGRQRVAPPGGIFFITEEKESSNNSYGFKIHVGPVNKTLLGLADKSILLINQIFED